MAKSMWTLDQTKGPKAVQHCSALVPKASAMKTWFATVKVEELQFAYAERRP